MATIKISAKDVKSLRDQTGAGMMDCKKALTEANGDLQAAIEYLRKKGQKMKRQCSSEIFVYFFGRTDAALSAVQLATEWPTAMTLLIFLLISSLAFSSVLLQKLIIIIIHQLNFCSSEKR